MSKIINNLTWESKQFGKFVIYNVNTQERKDKISELIEKHAKLMTVDDKDVLQASLSSEIVKDLLKTFSNVETFVTVDEISDEELVDIIDMDEDFEDLINELKDLLIKQMRRKYKQSKRNIQEVINGLAIGEDINSIMEYMNTLREKMNVSDELFNQFANGQITMEDLLKEQKKKIPQDRKPKRKTKKQLEVEKQAKAE